MCLRYTRYRGMAFFVWGHILLDKDKSYSPKLIAREDGKSNLPLYFRRENGIRGLWVSLCWTVVKNVCGSQMTWVRILVFLFLVELIVQPLKAFQVVMKIKCINSCKTLQKQVGFRSQICAQSRKLEILKFFLKKGGAFRGWNS